MSLALIQGYSSAEEENEDEAGQTRHNHLDISSDDNDDDDNIGADNSPALNRAMVEQSLLNLPQSSSTSLLPSALDVFSEVLFFFS